MLKSQEVIDNYFSPAFKAAHSLLSAETNFSKLGFDVYSQNSIEKSLSRCMFKKMGIDKFWENEIKVDICISISCFEHILDFSAAAQALANISHEKTIHIHIVNFQITFLNQDRFTTSMKCHMKNLENIGVTM